MLSKLKKILVERHIDQTEFEAMAGLPKCRISKWFGGTGEPSAGQALRMARALGIPLEYLVDDSIEVIPDDSPIPAVRMIWDVIRLIGPDEALRRLVGAASPNLTEGDVPPVPSAEPDPPMLES